MLMLGHILGSASQVAVESTCTLFIHNKPICATAGIVVHEFIVEPLVNSMIVNSIVHHTHGIDHSHGQCHEEINENINAHDQCHDESSSHSHGISKVIFGAIGAIMASQSLDHYYGHDSGCNHSGWNHIIVGSVVSLLGSISGNIFYEALVH